MRGNTASYPTVWTWSKRIKKSSGEVWFLCSCDEKTCSNELQLEEGASPSEFRSHGGRLVDPDHVEQLPPRLLRRVRRARTKPRQPILPMAKPAPPAGERPQTRRRENTWCRIRTRTTSGRVRWARTRKKQTKNGLQRGATTGTKRAESRKLIWRCSRGSRHARKKQRKRRRRGDWLRRRRRGDSRSLFLCRRYLFRAAVLSGFFVFRAAGGY